MAVAIQRERLAEPKIFDRTVNECNSQPKTNPKSTLGFGSLDNLPVNEDKIYCESEDVVYDRPQSHDFVKVKLLFKTA